MPALVIVALAASAWTAASVTPAHLPSPTPEFTSSSYLMVMPPLVAVTASPGSVGRDFPAIEADVTMRILSIVHERFPSAAVADKAERFAACSASARWTTLPLVKWSPLTR